MMTKFQDMWDGHLRPIKAVKHHIYLPNPGVRSIHWAPYHAEPETRAVEKDENDSMLKLDVIGPAQTEWVAPIVFAPKRDELICFCVDYGRLNEVISGTRALFPEWTSAWTP